MSPKLHDRVALEWLPQSGISSARNTARAILFGRKNYSRICGQLRARTESALDQWSDSERLRQVRDTVSPIIQDEFSWPNCRFVPDDPCEILLWEHSADCQIANAMADIDKALGIHLSAEETEDIMRRVYSMSYGELIAWFAALGSSPRSDF